MDKVEVTRFKMLRNPTLNAPSAFFEFEDLTDRDITGILVPWVSEINRFWDADFKLMTNEGEEYFILSDAKWKELLESLSWSTVLLTGKLSLKQSVFIPEKVLYISASNRV